MRAADAKKLARKNFSADSANLAPAALNSKTQL